MPKHVNSYENGLDRDSSPKDYPAGKYYEARNFRKVAEGLSSGAMNNVRGNEHITDLPSGQYIIGSGQIRDITVIFACTSTDDNPGGVDPDLAADPESYGYIYKINFNDASPALSLVFSGIFNFTTKHPIFTETIGRYKLDNVQKIYWADGFNVLRHINIEDPPSSVDKLDVVSDVKLSMPEFYNIGAGQLNTGRVQYAYKLYDLYGSDTVFSPASHLINLTTESDQSSDDREFEGANKLDDDGQLQNSGKSITININNIDTRFGKIQIVAIHYTTVDTVPTISVVSEQDVISDTLKVTDYGDYDLGTYTLSEFRTLGGKIFIPSTIETKDNILFAADIKNKYFDVDFDARAFRWRKAASVAAYVWNETDFDYIKKVSGEWPKAVYSTNDITGLPPETHNCINPFNFNPAENKMEEEASYNDSHWAACKYMSSLSLLGGEGQNVRYRFMYDKDIVLINNDDAREVYTNRYIKDSTNPHGGVGSYANVFRSSVYVGYKRDEIYRMAIVFFNNKGQQSFPKWIGDIRMPTIEEFPLVQAFGNNSWGKVLHMVFEVYVGDLPDDVVGYQIVRVKRENDDKTIAASGYISHTINDTNTASFFSPSRTINGKCSPALARIKVHSVINDIHYYARMNLIEFISPEELYYRNVYESSGDYIKLAGYYSNRFIYYHNMSFSQEFKGTWAIPPTVTSKKYQHYNNVYHNLTGLTTQLVYNIEDQKSLRPRTATELEATADYIGGYEYYNFAKFSNTFGCGKGGTKIVAKLDSGLSEAYLGGSDDYEIYYVDYKRNNAGSIYGGVYYTDRALNNYIPCGGYVDISILKWTVTTGGSGMITINGFGDVFEDGEISACLIVNIDAPVGQQVSILMGHTGNVLYIDPYTIQTGDRVVIVPSQNSGNIARVYGGDIYITMMDHVRSMRMQDVLTNTLNESYEPVEENEWPALTGMNDNSHACFSRIAVPCESTININYQNGWLYRKYNAISGDARSKTDHAWIQEEEGTTIERVKGILPFGTTVETREYMRLTQDRDMYIYNSAYSQQNTSKIYVAKPPDWVEIKRSDALVIHSDTSVNTEVVDSFLKFREESFIDLDTGFGPINKLLRWNNYLMFFQDKGVGTTSVNERQLIPVENNAALELGRGGVLDRYDMIATGIGCRHKQAIVGTEYGFYWFDVNKKAMYYYSGKMQNISDVLGLFSEFKEIPEAYYNYRNTIDSNGIMMFKNRKFDEVHLLFKMAGGYSDTFIFSELERQFTNTIDGNGRFYIDTINGLFSTLNNTSIYRENTGNYGEFYGTYYPSKIIYIINPIKDIVVVFNNFEFLSELFNASGVDQEESWTTVQQLNDYQDSGIVTFQYGGITRTGRNIRRLMRTWRFTDLRDNNSRFRDAYMKMILSFTNSADRKFVMNKLYTLYDVPGESITG